jgi:hypothetical protein
VKDAQKVAAVVSQDLHQVIDGLPDLPLHERPTILGEDKRVKAIGSLARKVRGRHLTGRDSVETILGGLKDRVRFSVALHEARFGETAQRIPHEFRNLGYLDITVDNFWSTNGRHNGVNVNLTTPGGFTLEIQFPTPLSVDVGLDTHADYEIVRRDDLPIEQQVSAFLTILHINRDRDIYAHVPQGLGLLSEFMTGPQPVDTTLASWIGKHGRLPAYREYLTRSGQSFDDVLRDHDLDIVDVPGMGELI